MAHPLMGLNPSPAPRRQALWRGLAGRRVQRSLWALLAALLLALAWDAWQLGRLRQTQAMIDALDDGSTPVAPTPTAASATDPAASLARAPAAAPTPADSPPAVQFAQAQALARQGALEPALVQYGGLLADPQLGPAARFNSANLLLRQGIALRSGAQPGQALALIELAKENYRALLRIDPAHWPARYNLDRAQRLVPEPDETEEEPAAAARSAERAATTMRGYAPGQP